MTMRKTTGFKLSTLLTAVALSAAGTSWAQQAPAPSGTSAPTSAPASRESPRPDQLEPGVNTSAPADDRSAVEGTPRNAGGAMRDNSSAPARPSPATTPAAAAGTNAQAAAPSDTNAQKPASSKGTSSSGTASGASQAVASGPNGATQAATPKSGASGKGQDRIELDTTQITGNRELPKVLYIVPWKRSDLGDLVGKPVNSLLDEVLAPVDRDVFKRENRYYEALKPDQGGAGGAGGSGAASPAPSGGQH